MECAFANGPVYCDKNWNCGIVNRIRELCYEGQDSMPRGVDYQYCDDQKYATVNVSEVYVGGDWENGTWFARALWVTWYKNRGGTEDMWLLGDEEPRRPTAEELEAIADYYEARTA